MINQSVVQKNWNKIKTDIQVKWDDLSTEDIEQTNGDARAIQVLLQKKYGISNDEAERQLETVVGQYQSELRTKGSEYAVDDDAFGGTSFSDSRPIAH